MEDVKRQNARLVVLLFLGGLALNYPLLAIFSREVIWFGIPLLYTYLFLVWAIFILLMVVTLAKRPPSSPSFKPKTPD